MQKHAITDWSGITAFRRQVVELRVLGATWRQISDVTGRSPSWCRLIYYNPKQRLYRLDLLHRVAQAIVELRATRIHHHRRPTDSRSIQTAYTRAVAAQTLSLAGAPGPAREALEAWMARMSGSPADPGVCPLCGAARDAASPAAEGVADPKTVQSGQSDRPNV